MTDRILKPDEICESCGLRKKVNDDLCQECEDAYAELERTGFLN